MHQTGTFSGLGPDALFYIGSGFYGNVITPTLGFAYGASYSFPDMNRTVTPTDVTTYQVVGTNGVSGSPGVP